MKFLLSLLFLTTLSASFAQQVEGAIYNEFKEPIKNVTITSTKKDDLHTHTSNNGTFKITNIPYDTLVIEKDGFLPQLIASSDIKNNKLVLIKEPLLLEKVIITNKNDVLNGVTNVELNATPNRSSQELLTLVPGLFVAKHAGGGKSDQIFLRGFDIDHGTDISIGVDDVPVNMVSHAHGQGYSDLHFVMPSLIDKIEFGKGTYDLTKGNFATAGYVNFTTKKRIDNNQLSFGYGMFNSKDIVGAINIFNNKKHALYIAGATDQRDGYFEKTQRFKRNNLMAKYNVILDESTVLTATAMTFNSSWDASGQIPERAVQSGQIGRFGAIDDTEGGSTSKQLGQIELNKFFKDNSSLSANVFYTTYDFELYSNFTFFLRDSINGDQIRQKENRATYGFKVDYEKPIAFGNTNTKWVTGVSARFDDVKDNELSYTKNRTETLTQVQLGDVYETNYSLYTGLDLTYKNLRINGGIRAEEFFFEYEDKLDGVYDPQKTSTYALLPKANIVYTLNKKLNVFAKWGMGTHSNDTRLIMSDKSYLDLPLVSSYDIGANFTPFKNLFVSATYWNMTSDQEFVYVGDEGVVEPSGKTIRNGVDFSIAYQYKSFMFLNANVNYTKARSVDGEEFIPLAAPLTSTFSAKFLLGEHFNLSIATRLMSDRPANEDNSAIAEGYLINDLSFGYSNKKWDFILSVDNILNEKWNETQFLTTSRLANETQPVEEIHFTPGEPRFVRGKIIYKF